MRVAIIEGGTVANVIVVEGGVLPDGGVPSDTADIGDLWDGEGFTPSPPAPLADRQAAAWERIKRERDRRKYLGVKVGAHWFHSDDASRIQQLALVIMGAKIPPGLKWKTLTFTQPPVLVTMTPALAQGIFQATAASDAAIFAAAEAHRLAMEASAEPQDYDISSGWPLSIEDEANQAGVQFDAKMI